MEDLYLMSAWRDSKWIRLLSCWEPVSVRDRALKAQLPSPVVTIGLKMCRSSGWHCCDASVSCDNCGHDSANGIGSALRMVTRVSRVDPCSVMVWITSLMGLSLRLCSIASGVTPPRAVFVACWSCLMPGGEGRAASASKGCSGFSFLCGGSCWFDPLWLVSCGCVRLRAFDLWEDRLGCLGFCVFCAPCCLGLEVLDVIVCGSVALSVSACRGASLMSSARSI